MSVWVSIRVDRDHPRICELYLLHDFIVDVLFAENRHDCLELCNRLHDVEQVEIPHHHFLSNIEYALILRLFLSEAPLDSKQEEVLKLISET